MDRRSFLLASLLPIVAAKQGMLGPSVPLRELCQDRLMMITLKARSIGMSRLVAAQMDRMTALTIYNYGHKS
jgi:hypothetical protein